MIERRKTRGVRYGAVAVGGDAPVSIQSMCTLPAAADGARAEILALARAGCEIVRVAVRDGADLEALVDLCNASPIPVIADVHFDHRLAVSAAGRGVAGVRINPGNIGGEERMLEVLEAARKAGAAVRIGVNAGSLEKDLRPLYRERPAEALFESAKRSRLAAEAAGFSSLVFSLKSSDPMVTVEANRLFSADCDHPLHVGVTEAGPVVSGTARSAVALVILLSEGIGDTIRISLSGDPVNEVVAAAALLSALGMRPDLPRIVSCPTCGRCRIDVAGTAERLERELAGLREGITVAVMGCEVNGPGEAREADLGVAGTKTGAVLFRKGRVVRAIEGDPLDELLLEIDRRAVKRTGGRGKK